MAARRIYTNEDRDNIIECFLKGGDNRTIRVAELTGVSTSYADKVISSYLTNKSKLWKQT